MRYLVAVDGWEPSHRALAFAGEQAGAAGATLDVVHVVGERGGDDRTIERIREQVAEALAEDLDHEFHVLSTDKRTKPADKVGSRLLEFAREHGHDAVYVGNEKTGTAERMIVGSVASTLIGAQEVPVMLVP